MLLNPAESLRPRHGRALLACAISIALGTGLVQHAAAAADPIPDPVVPDQAELERDPIAAGALLLELSQAAETADRAGDGLAALRAYRALARLVPDRALAFSKLCHWYKLTGERPRAIDACRAATSLPGVQLQDYLNYISLVQSPPPGQSLSPADVSDLDATFAHLEAQNIATADVEVFMCQLGVKLEDVGRLERCLEKLERKAPGSPYAFPYRFSLALIQGDSESARSVVRQAKASGLGAQAVALMEQQLEARGGTRLGWPVLTALLAMLGGGGWLLWWTRRRGAASVRPATGDA